MNMKRFICFVAASLMVFGAVAQPQKIQEAPSLNYYGIDFSSAKVIGASEPAEQFVDVFEKINLLVVGEPAKYDLKKAFRKEIGKVDPSVVESLNEKIDPKGLKMYSGSYRLSPETIVGKVAEYQIPDKEGLGVVLIAEQLDKSEGVAT